MTSTNRTLKRLTYKLTNNPFFPLLFISEAVKIGALSGLTQNFWVMVALSVVSTIIWVVSDAVEFDVDLDEENIIG